MLLLFSGRVSQLSCLSRQDYSIYKRVFPWLSAVSLYELEGMDLKQTTNWAIAQQACDVVGL